MNTLSWTVLACVLTYVALVSAQPEGKTVWYAMYNSQSIEGSPAIVTHADGSAPSLFYTNYGGSVFGLNGRNGSMLPLPVFYEGEMIRVTPAAYRWPRAKDNNDGAVWLYFGTSDAFFYAIDSITAQVQWKYNAGEPVDEFQGSSPAIWDNSAVAGGKVMIFYGTVSLPHGKLVALDARTGTLLWNVSLGKSSYSSPQLHTLADGSTIIVIGCDDGTVTVWDALSGAARWTHQTAGMVRGSFAFTRTGDGRDVVYFGSNDNAVYALNARDGSVVFKYVTGGMVYSTPAVWWNGDHLTLFVGSYDQKLYSLDGLTGKQLWNFSAVGYVIANPLVVTTGTQTSVYVGCDQTLTESFFYAIDAQSGVLQWQSWTSASVWASARTIPDTNPPLITFSDQSGTVWALQLP